MVDKSIILKTLNESISKCRKPSYSIISVSNHVKGAMNRFAKNTRTETIEHGVVIDGQGHTLVEVDGNENSVYIPTVETITNVLQEKCKDILEEYLQEYDTWVNDGREDETMFLWDRYQNKIYERINELNLSFHVDHNHPGAYSESDLDYNMFTCLSDKDMDNCLLSANIRTHDDKHGFGVENIVKSKTAECSNGSRMTLVNNNPPNRSVSKSDFNKARDNLLKAWGDYSVRIKNDALHYAHGLVDSGKYSETDVKRDRNDFKTEIGRDVNEYIKKRSKEIFPIMINKNIREFKELGFELRFDWL